MTEIKAKPRKRPPAHPGAILRDTVIPHLGLTVTDVAKAIYVTRQQLHRVLSEESGISPGMALRLGKFCGNGPTLWMRMQEAYDLWHADRAIGSVVDKIETMSSGLDNHTSSKSLEGPST